MKHATGLTLISVGAILAFAITAQPSFLDLRVVGLILVLTGGIGLAVPRTGKRWRRTRSVWRDNQPHQEVDIEETETDSEQRFSSLLVPGGINDRYDDRRDTADPAED